MSEYAEPDGGRFEFNHEEARRQWDQEARKLGRFNLAVLGKTGVGKSTLVNAIFGSDVASTGVGQPVTQGGHLYVEESEIFGLYDTKGLEVGVPLSELLEEIKNLVESRRGADPSTHIHAAYYCVRAGDNRFESAEADFVRGLHSLGLPVLLVMTQVDYNGKNYRTEHLQLAKHIEGLGLPIHNGRPYLTAAKPDPQLGFPAHGLQALLTGTYEIAPEQSRSALAAAQRIDRQLKRRYARRRIATAVAGATAVGATPVPFADALAIAPIQTTMMLSISRLYGIPMDTAFVAAVSSSTVATNAGRIAATSALKLVPGVNVLAASVAAGVAGSFTLAIGESWIRVCEMILDEKFGPVKNLDMTDIQQAFLDVFKTWFSAEISRRSESWDKGSDNA